jgi:hypothetical protein
LTKSMLGTTGFATRQDISRNCAVCIPRTCTLQSSSHHSTRITIHKTSRCRSLRTTAVLGMRLADESVRFASMQATALQPGGGREPRTEKGET